MATNNPFAKSGKPNPFIPAGAASAPKPTAPKPAAPAVIQPDPEAEEPTGLPFDNQTSATPTPTAAPLPGRGSAVENDVFEADLTEADNGLILPDSLYALRCIDVEQGVSNSGNPQFTWTFAITQGEYAGREFKLWTALTPAAMWKVAEVIVALGVGEVGKAVRFHKKDVLGKECVGVIEETEYKGRKRSSIARVMTFKEAQEY